MHWDGTVTLGNLLTILVMIAAVWRYSNKTVVWQKGVELAQAQILKWIDAHERCSKEHKQILDEVRNGLSYLRGKAEQRRASNHFKDEVGD